MKYFRGEVLTLYVASYSVIRDMKKRALTVPQLAIARTSQFPGNFTRDYIEPPPLVMHNVWSKFPCLFYLA